MSDILEKICAVKREEIAAAQRRMPLAEMRRDAESRVLTRDLSGRCAPNWPKTRRR